LKGIEEMNKLPITTLLLAICLVLFSCKKEEGCADSTAINFNIEAEVDDGSCVYDQTLSVPSTYSFTDGNGNSTVSFNGQAQRLEMLSEMVVLMKTANTSGVSVDTQMLLDMYANDTHIWNDIDELGMNGSSKNLKSKTAASTGSADPAIQAVFEQAMTAMAAASQSTQVDNPNGESGQAGVVVSTSNPEKRYLFDEHGSEYTQRIEKGLMGAVMMNQISSWYLADDQMNVDNTAAVDAPAGKHYTQMEHHWDEAYGYFTTATEYPMNGTDRFWGKYANGREELLSSATTISSAFRTGRAAIATGDLDTRDVQIGIIRFELEQVAAASAVHYLNEAMSNLVDPALRNHALSEAVAFVEAIPYCHEPQLNSTTVQGLVMTLGDFYMVSTTGINTVKDHLVDAYGFEAIQDEL